eukprot:TRINITY_DN3873_c0_g2_i1.p1 TRINITY_DN3873_c0_g2~~TRINITY_DN3873_c0_g2_i1.p1  ORF type:complete len:818 (-),score=185.58 TRINITY_DN3873_c0_g2_i1:57-2315(-)
MATLLLAYPTKLLPIFDEAIKVVEEQLQIAHSRKDDMTIKPNVHIRLGRLPQCDLLTKEVMPRSSDVGLFMELHGTIIRAGPRKTIEWERTMECTSCKATFVVYADMEQRNTFPKNPKCPSSDANRVCNSKGFRFIEGSEKCHDYQEIKIQEHVGKVGVGVIPRSIPVVLMDDLVDLCKAGDEVTLSGTVRQRWPRTPFEDERCDVEMFIVANSIRVHNQQRYGISLTEDLVANFKQYWISHREDPLTGRNNILKSLCPNIYGLYTVKLALALVMIGGVTYVDKSGMHVRGESHLLLVGEPGTGKSQVLKYAAMIAPRSVITTGIGTTSAGLTVAAVKETGGEWVLEAGALVLADGGVCCIDEFSAIRERDRATIHEAMEQQTLSVAKVGLVCKLQTRTTVIAATNPKGRYDPSHDIYVNTTLASPLLSRFDLVFVLLDDQDKTWDRQVSTFILQGQIDHQVEDDSHWSISDLRSYFLYAKSLKPDLSDECRTILAAYYKKQRQADLSNSPRTTIRLLESLIRLTQAHARLMARKYTLVQDAVTAVLLVEASMHTSALLGLPNTLHSIFPEDPIADYRALEFELLKRLNLSHLSSTIKSEDRAPSPPTSPPYRPSSPDVKPEHAQVPSPLGAQAVARPSQLVPDVDQDKGQDLMEEDNPPSPDMFNKVVDDSFDIVPSDEDALNVVSPPPKTSEAVSQRRVTFSVPEDMAAEPSPPQPPPPNDWPNLLEVEDDLFLPQTQAPVKTKKRVFLD